MSKTTYHAPIGQLPPQTQLLTGRAVFKEAYAVIPGNVMTDIVTSQLPSWSRARFWIIARPLTGFSNTFSQYICELESKGGSENPEPDQSAEAVLFIVNGNLELTIQGRTHHMEPGGYAYLPAGERWSVANNSDSKTIFHWIRKAYEPVEGLDQPEYIITNEKNISLTAMPGTNGKWATTRFVDVDDLRHDMHVNIITMEPGAVIPFTETHVMEHGLYVLMGKAVYRLNEDWVEVEAGDYMWLRAFCPQACYAGGPGKFRYLLYKNVNRHMPLNST